MIFLLLHFVLPLVLPCLDIRVLSIINQFIACLSYFLENIMQQSVPLVNSFKPVRGCQSSGLFFISYCSWPASPSYIRKTMLCRQLYKFRSSQKKSLLPELKTNNWFFHVYESIEPLHCNTLRVIWAFTRFSEIHCWKIKWPGKYNATDRAAMVRKIDILSLE